MRKLFAAACAALWSVATLQAQPAELRFRDDGTFRIAQFTDMHLDPSKPRRLAESEKTFARLERVLTSERPDLVVFTGDVVTGAAAECGAGCSMPWSGTESPSAWCWATTMRSRTSPARRSPAS